MKSILNVNGVKKLSKELQKSINGSGPLPGCYQLGNLCCPTRSGRGACGIGYCDRFCRWG
ncbi:MULTISPECIES: hypothetical protein [Aquimarina]|uniref:hypothetical protein n=1 Tax=Aquimarina TaxID=290174 RepID=UPI0009456C85|nr:MULTISPECIES: hypothetical protein [Aquimarina]